MTCKYKPGHLYTDTCFIAYNHGDPYKEPLDVVDKSPNGRVIDHLVQEDIWMAVEEINDKCLFVLTPRTTGFLHIPDISPLTTEIFNNR